MNQCVLFQFEYESSYNHESSLDSYVHKILIGKLHMKKKHPKLLKLKKKTNLHVQYLHLQIYIWHLSWSINQEKRKSETKVWQIIQTNCITQSGIKVWRSLQTFINNSMQISLFITSLSNLLSILEILWGSNIWNH